MTTTAPTRRVILAALIAFGLVAGLQAPASAASFWDTRYPKVVFPITQKESDGGKLTVVVEVRMPPNAWRPRRVVRNYDRRINAINFVFGKCADRPHVSCTVIRQERDPSSRYWGRMEWSDTRPAESRHVILNRAYGVERKVTCHEVGHALGLSHHEKRPGCLGAETPNRERASRYEMKALRGAY